MSPMPRRSNDSSMLNKQLGSSVKLKQILSARSQHLSKDIRVEQRITKADALSIFLKTDRLMESLTWTCRCVAYSKMAKDIRTEKWSPL